jgi:hypothetical protein
MHLNHIGKAEGANLKAVRYLPTDLCATGKRSAGRSCRRTLLRSVIAVAAALGSAQPSACD